MDSNTIILSISLMTSNRKETIRKCLDSLEHLRKVVPSELIVVDTGCDDEMLGILREYTNQIIRFEWCNDFAKARNAGLFAAQGQWFMFIDDDEWFEDTREIEDFFLSGAYRKYGEADYVVRNYGKLDGSEYQDCFVKRMIYRTEETRFEGRIHEVLQPQYANRIRLNSFAHHYGYAYESQEENVRHGYRNIEPLLLAVAENPRDMHLRVQLAQEYNVVDEYRNLEEICLESIQMLEGKTGRSDRIYRGSFYSGHVYSLYRMGRAKECYETCERYLEQPCTKLTETYLYRWQADAAYLMQDKEACKQALAAYDCLWQEFQRNPEVFWEEDMILSRQSVSERYREAMNILKEHMEYGAFILTEETEQRRDGYAELIRLEEQSPQNPRALASIYYQMGERKRQERLCLQQLEYASEDDYEYYRLGYVDALFTECRYDKACEEIEASLHDERLSEASGIMLTCEGCISEYRRKNYEKAVAYGKEYRVLCQLYASDVTEDNPFLYTACEDNNQKRILSIMQDLQRIMLESFASYPDEDVAEMVQILLRYLDCGMPEEELGQQVYAGFQKFVHCDERDDVTAALQALKGIVGIDGAVNRGIQKLTQLYSAYVQQQMKNPEAEMQQLATQLKKQAKALYESGDVAAARSILDQLFVLMPNDEELKELRENY